MPKTATKMRAQRGSKCSECHYPIVVGTNIKVYDNKWLHTKCWSDVNGRKTRIKDTKKIIKTFIDPPINHLPRHEVTLEKFTNKIIDSLGVINKEIDSIWEYIGKEKTTADEYNERSNSNN